MHPVSDDDSRGPVGRAVDLFVYAPIGLFFEGPELLPKLVEQGKGHVRTARFFGEFAVKQGRKEVDPDKITVYSQSMGSHWGLAVAAMGDPIIKANVGIWASYLDKYYILDTFSPRYKQLFGYLTGAKSEEERGGPRQPR